MSITLFLIALLPIAALIILLGVAKTPAHVATPIALVTTAALAMIFWQMPAIAVLGAAAEGAAMGLWPIMIVIVAAIFSFNVAKASGSIDAITKILESVTTDKRVQVLILAWGFGGFLEAVAGYGTAVAIPASILAALGFNPFFAAVISLIANTVPTAFGAIGIPVSTLATLTDLDPNLLSAKVALQLTPFIILLPFVLVMITGKSAKAVKGVVGVSLAAGLGFAIPHYLVARFLGPQLPALIGSIGALASTIVVAKWQNRSRSSGASFRLPYLWFAWRPYVLILLFVLLATPLFPPIYHFLNHFSTAVAFVKDAKPLTFYWVSTPGALIILATIASALLAKMPLRRVATIFAQTTAQLSATFVTVLAIVALAKVMGHSGMINTLAVALATLTGPAYPFLSPLIGTLGTFVTGSDTSSNVLFGKLQSEISTALGVDPYWLSAANTAGATAGKMISPQSIAVATSATGLTGREGDIFGKTILFCLGYVTILGVLVGVLT